MRRTLIAGFSVACLLAGSAAAQTTPSTGQTPAPQPSGVALPGKQAPTSSLPTTRETTLQDQYQSYRAMKKPQKQSVTVVGELFKPSALAGAKIVDKSGKTVGTVRDLLVDSADHVDYVVANLGDLVKKKTLLVAVPVHDLLPKGKRAMIDKTRDRIKQQYTTNNTWTKKGGTWTRQS